MADPLTIFAETDFRNQHRAFGIRHADRRLPMHILGKTGVGKSTLLQNLVAQDLRNGHGLCVIDPHGDLVRSILDYVPPVRTGEVVYFNPADRDFPIGFNILESVDPSLRPLVASHVISVFKHIWADSWGPRLEFIFHNAVLALLDVEGSTLLGIPRLLADKTFRMRVLAQVRDPVVRNFWLQEYENYNPEFQKEAIAPIQNKVGQFLTSAPIRNIVGQVKSKMEMGFIMDQGRILLCDLAKGRVGEDKASLLGSLLVTKLFLAALRRTDQPEEERRDFYLFIDECQNLATTILAPILSEARKYRLNLVISHQYLGQLDPEIKQAMLGNVGTLVSFRLGAEDAFELAREFAPEVTAQDLENTDKHQVYLKLAVDGLTSRPFSARTLPPAIPSVHEQNRETIIRVSREKYAMRREVIEEKITRWLAGSTGQQK
jgi:hypothetical protein